MRLPRGTAINSHNAHRDQIAEHDDASSRARHISWSFDGTDALEGRRVRRAFASALRAAGYSDSALFRAELVFGELLGNIVRHADGQAEMTLHITPNDVILHVLDRGPGFARDSSPSDEWAEHGRGMLLVERLTDDLSVTQRPGGGAHVRAVLNGGF